MYHDFKKLLKEPLLWIGGVALCIPILASGQMGKLKQRLSFDNGGPHAQSVKIADRASPGSTTADYAPIKIKRTSDLPDRGLVGANEGPESDLKTSVWPPGRSPWDTTAETETKQPLAQPAAMPTLPAVPEVALTRSLPEPTPEPSPKPQPEALPESQLAAVPGVESEIAISPLPRPAENADPGSLMDLATAMDYENTPEPKLADSILATPEPSESGADETSNLKPGANKDSLSFEEEQSFAESKRGAYESAIADQDSVFDATPSFDPADHQQSPNANYYRSPSLPSVPMRFQAALRPSAITTGRYDQTPSLRTSVGTNFQAALAEPATSVQAAPIYSAASPSHQQHPSQPIPRQVIQPTPQQSRGSTVSIWDD